MFGSITLRFLRTTDNCIFSFPKKLFFFLPSAFLLFQWKLYTCRESVHVFQHRPARTWKYRCLSRSIALKFDKILYVQSCIVFITFADNGNGRRVVKKMEWCFRVCCRDKGTFLSRELRSFIAKFSFRESYFNTYQDPLENYTLQITKSYRQSKRPCCERDKEEIFDRKVQIHEEWNHGMLYHRYISPFP